VNLFAKMIVINYKSSNMSNVTKLGDILPHSNCNVKFKTSKLHSLLNFKSSGDLVAIKIFPVFAFPDIWPYRCQMLKFTVLLSSFEKQLVIELQHLMQIQRIRLLSF